MPLRRRVCQCSGGESGVSVRTTRRVAPTEMYVHKKMCADGNVAQMPVMRDAKSQRRMWARDIRADELTSPPPPLHKWRGDASVTEMCEGQIYLVVVAVDEIYLVPTDECVPFWDTYRGAGWRTCHPAGWRIAADERNGVWPPAPRNPHPGTNISLALMFYKRWNICSDICFVFEGEEKEDR